MKKLNLWLLMSLFVAAFAMTACGGDDEDTNSNGNSGQNQPATGNDLIGSWSYRGTTYVFTNDKLTVKEREQEQEKEVFQGSYTYENGKLTVVGMQEDQQVTKVATVKVLYDKSVLVLKYASEHPEEYSLDVIAEVYFKEGKTAVTPASDIQGTWHWYMNGDKNNIRTGVMINGDKIEIIITPWSERHVGTFTYSQGILHLNMTEFYSGRGEHGYGFGEGGINPATLECDNWIPCTKEDIGDHLPSEMLFVTDGTEAYGGVAGLPAVFVKK